jgi:hypothetical protein
LELNDFKGELIDFTHSKINFREINVKKCLSDINFVSCDGMSDIIYLNLSEYKGEKIDFRFSDIKFEKINLYNNKSILKFIGCSKLNKELQKKFNLSKGIDDLNNMILLKYHTKEDLLKLYKDGLINLTKLKHLTEFKDIYNFLKTHSNNDFNLFESLISFKSF